MFSVSTHIDIPKQKYCAASNDVMLRYFWVHIDSLILHNILASLSFTHMAHMSHD